MRTLLAAIWMTCVALAQDSVVDLSILHFNDFHSRLSPSSQGIGGAAYLATAIKRERANCPRCLLLNAGDNAQGSPVSTIFRGLPVFEVLRPLNTDAFVLGNHEFDYGYERINDFLATAGHPVLAANFLTGEGRLFTEAGSVIIERDGLRIGIVGVLMEDLVPGLTTPTKFGPNKMLPALETLRNEAAKLKGKTDILIALVHLFRDPCDQIVSEIPDYAITISGHDHVGKETMFRAEDRIGVRLRSYGAELGRLDLRYDKSTRKIVSSNWKRIPITTAAFEPDPQVAALVEKWESKVRAVVDTPIGTAQSARDRAKTKTWIESVMRQKTNAQFVFMNSGGVRDNLPQGQILARHVWNIMPFDNTLVLGRVKGKLIPDFIRGEAILDPEQLYTVATIDFLVEGWRNAKEEAVRAFGRAMPLDGPMLRDVLIDSIKANPNLD
ncbi:MAG: bifunctional metallophosphatase/5'-nucleotidase [Acidobacteria bacterium]|nr:bifunctional metallophosphatase/5'-nucleotidase [Acidobacteriota bacterium]